MGWVFPLKNGRCSSIFKVFQCSFAGFHHFFHHFFISRSKLSFSPGPGMSAWRSGCTAAPLSAEQLLVVGGFDGSNHLDSTELLDLKETQRDGEDWGWVNEVMGHVRCYGMYCGNNKI